jgi:sialate O-acetylesterase
MRQDIGDVVAMSESQASCAPTRTERGWMLSLLIALCVGTSTSAAAAEPLLHPIFQEHAVVQRDAPIRLYGRATPGTTVSLSFGDATADATADARGEWQAVLPSHPAGGPHVLMARSGSITQRVEDVLVGDVWLCSGQSNMVLQVHRSLDARAEIANAGNEHIRMLTVGETGSATPLDTFATPVQWKRASSQTAADFSATCFYFARELQKTVDVPMGLVVAAWGGSRIQAWASAEALGARGDLDDELEVLAAYARDPAAGTARWGEHWGEWWHARADTKRGDEPWGNDRAAGKDWQDAPPQLGAWERWGVPELESFDGMVWYRTAVRLTAEQAKQSAVLELGAVDEVDMTWVNGRAVGSAYAPGQKREYPIPTGLLRAGANSVAINVLDTYRDGGVAGPAEAHALRFEDGTRVVLDSHWRYRRVASSEPPPRAPWHTAAGLTTLYNGMIAPIGRYGFRGVLWYQGESNTFEAARYGEFLAALIADWRQRFDAPLPWLNVQLAGYGLPRAGTGNSGWAEMREVQRRYVEQDPRYGIATAVDIGDRYDIHPPNKQELGRRLARLARHLVYGETSLSPTGPQPASARREVDSVLVTFADVTGSLVAYGADQPIGFELCASSKGPGETSERTCRYAAATLEGKQVRLRSPDAATATHVRHAWADSPVITLFDAAGLPTQPFEISIAAASEN